MTKQITNSLYDQLIADFELRSILSNSSESVVLHALRKEALKQFRELGFPNTKVEDWKYINLSPFLKDDFLTSTDDELVPVSNEVIEAAKVPQLDAHHIVVVNGRFRPELSDRIPCDDFHIAALADAMNTPAFVDHFGRYVALNKHHFAALNTALFSDGIFIEVKDRATVTKPIHLIQVVVSDQPVFLQPRNLFVIGAGAEITIVESFVTAGNYSRTAPRIFINNVSEIVVKERARVQHYCIQNGKENTSYIHHTEIVQHSGSIYNNYKASLPGTALLRNNLNVALNGENIESHLFGLYLVAGKQIVDNHTAVDHLKPNCHSNELYKGVMKDEAVAIFNGKILVRKNAQKTNAFQKNNNLMLSKKAVVDSKPQLEIFADDVKCSHGSTIGQFDDDALFYLKARGIGEEKARALLIHAFAFDVTGKIPSTALQVHINHLIEEGLMV
ncbi:MAG: Fe-S cluster assembly protein SufD [Ferruginibacter sp.]